MARGKSPFSLHKRPASKKEEEKRRQGRTKIKYVYYMQFRDADGNHTSAMSTGQSSKGSAQEWAYNYLRQGNIPVHRDFTFERFSSGWWDSTSCGYLKEKERMGHKLSPRYVEESRRNLNKHLLPYFGSKKITSIR